MGWTGIINGIRWKNNGTMDRKATMDNQIECYGTQKVVKSSMVGTVYYAAVKNLKKYVKADDGTDGFKYIDLPENEQNVWGLVCLTSVNGYEFLYKDMSEDMIPFNYDCPVSILKLLSDTDNENCLEWRKRCMETREKKKAERKDPHSLKNIPIGGSIQFIARFDTTCCKAGTTITLTKYSRHGYRRDTEYWYGLGYRWPVTMIPEDYIVLSA